MNDNNLITNALDMTRDEVDALRGKQVFVELRKPAPIKGTVTDVKTCLGDVGRCGIYVDGMSIALDNIESIRIINNNQKRKGLKMKTSKFKLMALLMCVAAAFSFVSCEKELTNESVVGKKMYTNKLPGLFDWFQSEIRFAANNTAYLTTIYTDYVTGEERTSELEKATYNLVYPDVVFEDEDGRSYSATFVDNKTLVFDGPTIDEEEEVMGRYYPYCWRTAQGWSFYKNPHDITGPYAGQHFEGYSDYFYYYCLEIDLGVNYASIGGGDYIGRLVVNYPTIAIGDIFEGRFLDANRIQITKWNGTDVSDRNIILTRTR